MIMSWESWGLFIFSCLMLNLAPGPDMVYMLSRAIGYGRKVGLAAATGVCTGALVHAFAAALGLSAILATSATAFLVVKWIGAIYLVWLGLRAIFSTEARLAISQDKNKSRPPALKAVFLQGVLIDILNPKVALFFLAFLPQFISTQSTAIMRETLTLGVIVVLIALFMGYIFVFLSAPLGHYLRGNPRLALWLDRAFGGLLVFLGGKLALATR